MAGIGQGERRQEAGTDRGAVHQEHQGAGTAQERREEDTALERRQEAGHRGAGIGPAAGCQGQIRERQGVGTVQEDTT